MPFNATVVGWGATYEETDDEISIVTSRKQQKLLTPIVSNEECLDKYKEKGLDLKDEILYVVLSMTCLFILLFKD